MNDEYPDMKEEDYPALGSAALPQYASSPAFRDRLLIAAHEPGSQIQRCEPVDGPKYVEATELEADQLAYFIDNKASMADEFLDELVRLHPEGQAEYQTFCQVISEDWFDGKTRRTTGRCRQLKRSVLEYLGATCKPSWHQLISGPENPTDVDPLISRECLEAILKVNGWMLCKHIEKWKQRRPDNRFISDGDLYLRRGLRLDQPFEPTAPYVEFDFINSYSIAFTAPEKFSQKYGQIAAIVNGELALFEGRVLFFSPFICDMDARQLEFGVIPSCRPLQLHCQGDHGGILEYLIDPPPFQRG
jgi:hypothetical protein